MKILLIDDTKSVHIYTKDLLRRFAHLEFLDAYDGREGILQLQKDPDIQLILLDWEMPVMNGLQTLETIRKDLKLETPIIMVTTKNSMEDIERMIAAGASEYMMKPFTIDILVEKINSVAREQLKYVG